jgi:2-amino-4-hydroxy-6-hydroxymethyldihydropteridine diphosphokinase
VSRHPVLAAIGLGSNLGDRARHLDTAAAEIGRIPGVRVVRVSSWIETDPVGGPPDQGRYLNGAALVETALSAHDLLRALEEIERAHGRDRTQAVENGPRTLDLDLLTHGLERHDEPGLCVPHPRLAERAFVLLPLAEIAPDLLVPGRAARDGAEVPPAANRVRDLVLELARRQPGGPAATALGLKAGLARG